MDEAALARIDAALARIEAVLSAAPPGALAGAADLTRRHAALRTAVAGVIGRIDDLIHTRGAPVDLATVTPQTEGSMT